MNAKEDVAMDLTAAEKDAVAEISKMNMLNKRLGMLCLMRRKRSLCKLDAFPESKGKIIRGTSASSISSTRWNPEWWSRSHNSSKPR